MVQQQQQQRINFRWSEARVIAPDTLLPKGHTAAATANRAPVNKLRKCVYMQYAIYCASARRAIGAISPNFSRNLIIKFDWIGSREEIASSERNARRESLMFFPVAL